MPAWTPRSLRFVLNWYPPYLGAGVHVDSISSNWHEMNVSMALRFYNRNAVGTHFGGSLYSMVDPHLMLMFMQILGKEFTVWDYSASIRFIKPGTGKVHANITIAPESVVLIKEETKNGQKLLQDFLIEVRNAKDEIVAEISKTLYFRLKD